MTRIETRPAAFGAGRIAGGAGTAIVFCIVMAASLLGCAGPAVAETARYPSIAPIAQYQIENQAEEVALARSAAPPSVSDGAEILTLGNTGYETAAKGGNGFVCIVERSWANDPGDAEFWNPKVRGPICFNPASVRSVLPTYLQRTQWVLAGLSKAEIVTRTKAAIAGGQLRPPEIGAMCCMMSKGGYLGDAAGGHWHPHLMFFLPREAGHPPDWGANLPGSPVLGGDAGLDPAAIYYVLVAKWSDGTVAVMGM